MRVCFFASEKEREQDLAAAFVAGLKRHGDYGVVQPSGWPAELCRDFDAAAMVGVKSKALYDECLSHGVTPIMLDKGYTRHRAEGSRTWEYWRVAVGSHHPTRYLMDVRRPADRFARLNLSVLRWRTRGEHIVFAGSSAKYHAFYALPDPTSYAQRIVADLKKRTRLPIIYRPKPSWRDAVEIDGTTFSPVKQPLAEVLHKCHAVVTHGSNICFEAVLSGVPCIVLGDAVARPLSSTSLDEIEAPLKADPKQKRQWLANLAYCQWTMDEFRSGDAWRVIREQAGA